MPDLNVLAFIVLGLLLTGYAILDGFDLGVGILHPLSRGDRERRIFVNSIGPLWDGNEVWLVTFGGALFAAFPEAYATVFTGFYNAFMALLFALILRAVSLEFRGKVHSDAWRRFWDFGFFGGSLLAAVLFGVAVGNAMIGIPLNERGEFVGTFGDLLGPYPLMVGALTAAMFAMHGAIYLHLKTEHDLQERLHGWMWHTWGLFLVLYILTTMYTLVTIDRAVPNFEDRPWVAGVVVLNVLAIANIPRAIYAGRTGQAFISSCVTIAALVLLFSLAIYPDMVASKPNPENSLTIYNAASSQKTLGIILLIAAIGMPLVLAYTFIVYWTFRGKVKIEEHGY